MLLSITIKVEYLKYKTIKYSIMKAQKIYLEHANITVSNLKESIHFFQTAFPHFKIRGGGKQSREWIHLGDDTTYLALNQFDGRELLNRENYDDLGINHIAFVVENVSEITERLLKAGYKRDFPSQNEKYRTREYFADKDGNEYEFIQYLSDVTSERNSYDD